ncbi:Cupin domain-containing protein [Tistlia consotensis]|uniref:Cupin domain-containing protein n=1 Tax=Tistlia consotensis USBA 355 TaxID=560819 RepID=A0A1Y6C9T7_9PROT|nr:cupin domain-containing protein [Tistlia consotensis]SMF53475.1 Cupin domain-containing protein [Tistlia consotensis USBA 355]SNR85574.1 Cupin domain-containing protein [Tistlia consotensis]
MTPSITLTPASDIDTLWVIRDRVRFSGQLGGTQAVMLEVEVPPGATVPVHRHVSPELYRVLSGEVVFTTLVDGLERQMTGRAGDVLDVPSGAPHGYANNSGRPAEMLVVVDRTMAAFFRDLGTTVAAEGPPSEAELARVGEACARHGISFCATSDAPTA